MNSHTHNKEKLEEEKKILKQELARLGVENKETGDWEATPDLTTREEESDENDQADHFEEFEERSALLGSLEKRLQQVLVALKKIDDDAYGMCEVCHSQIEEARLGANPAASTCIAHMNE